jgi:hypothetical protein
MHTWENTLIVGFEYPGPLKSTVWPWLERHGLLEPILLDVPGTFPNYRRVAMAPLIVARNRAVRDFILPVKDKYEWVMMINRDITPTVSSDALLTMQADLKCIECATPVPTCWQAADSWHNHFSLIRMEVFAKMPPPWFQYIYSDDGCDLLDCDCGYFATKAKALGFTVAHGGYCSHEHGGNPLCFPPG